MYVIFEGIDTSGKSTQIKKLCEKNSSIISTQEPGGTDIGKNLRDMILSSTFDISQKTEFFLFLADRAEHYEKIIKPNSEKLIISDRGFISGMSYAFCNDADLQMEFLIMINQYALTNTFPDKIVFFEMSEDLLKQRLSEKPSDEIEKRGIEYLLNVQNTMKTFIGYLSIECLNIDASQSIDEITKQIEEFIND